MPSGARHKIKGGDKDSAAKNTFNPPSGEGKQPTAGSDPGEQDPKRRQGQFGGEGSAPIMRK